MESWDFEQLIERIYFRMRNTVGFADMKLGDDDKQVQSHQLELYQGEVRNGVNRIQQFGVSTMPLPGSKGLVLHHGGARSIGTVVAVEHADYRPKGLKPGEQHGYMVDGADADGKNGTMRSLWKGTLGWVHSIFGKTINVGNDTDVQTINIGHSGSLTINVAGGTINLNIPNGDIVVNGKSLVHHTHSDPQGGNTGPPN